MTGLATNSGISLGTTGGDGSLILGDLYDNLRGRNVTATNKFTWAVRQAATASSKGRIEGWGNIQIASADFTETPTPPPLQFSYRKEGATVTGDPSAGVDLKMDGVNVSWKYDAKSSAYLRFQNGKAHNDAALGQINASNVVVLVVDYVQSAIYAPSPIAQTLGTGEVFLFSGGKAVHGKWSRDDRLKPFTLTADDGQPMLLTPGRTWVELARVDTTTTNPA